MEARAEHFFDEGVKFAELGQYSEAITSYDKAIAIDPDDADAWYNRGLALFYLGRHGEAVNSYDKAIAIDPDDADSWYNRGNALRNLGRYAAAIVSFDKAIELDPDDAYAWNFRGLALEELGDRHAEAIASYDKALELNPDIAEEWETDRLKDFEEKIQQWKQAGYETSTLEILKGQDNLDFIHSRIKDYEDRVSQLEKIGRDLQELNHRYPVEFTHPDIRNAVELFKTQMKNPMRISDCEAQISLIRKNIEEISRSKSQRDQRIQYQVQLLRDSIEPVNGLGIDISAFFIHAKSQDSEHTENNLRDMAEAGYSALNNEINLVQKEGIIVNFSNDEIRTLIDDKNYAGAIIAAGKMMSGISALKETYSEAVQLKNKLGPSPVTALFNSGNYEQFLDEGEEILDLISQCTTLTAKVELLGYIPENIPKNLMELSKEQLFSNISALNRIIQESEEIKHIRVSAHELFEKTGAFGIIPDGIPTNIDELDKPLLERTISELEKFLKTAKPDLTFSMGTTRFVINRWHKTKISIANQGNAHAHDINFIISQEFDTKWIEETNVKAQGSTDVEIGLLPKTEGNIPLEITAKYHDGHNKEYTSRNRFWIEVVDKLNSTDDPGMTPVMDPVSHFIPKPTTLKKLPPDVSSRYTESEFLGKGGFARVFKAKRKDGKYVAVKIPISLDAATGKSFITEMQNWMKLSHPNIVKLYDFNIMPMPFFEEELCESTLADRNKPLACEEAAWILFNICEGLKFAHAQKIIHRDLKPQNILLKNGVPKISDWGLSKIISESTTTATTSFTLFYAAPEQINNRLKDERTDIWQLGVILYELVTGVLPFTGDSMIEIGMNIVTKDPKRPGEIIPDAKVMDDVVMKCLRKDPAKRHQSVLELQKDLALYLGENYTELLKTSVTSHDDNRSAYYCGDLVMVNLLTGDMTSAYKYLLDLVHYSKSDVKVEARELSEQIKMRIEMGVTEIPDELIRKAEMIVHQVSAGIRIRE